MKPSEVISMTRLQTNTSTDIVSDIDAYRYMNIILDDFWKDISDNNTWLDLTTWTYDTSTAGTQTLPVPIADTTLTASTFGLQDIVKIGIKYITADHYTPVSLVYVESMLRLPEYYSDLGTSAKPVALTDWTTLTIYPAPDEVVTDWLRIVWNPAHFELGTTGSAVVTEDVAWCMLIPRQRHYLLVEWLKYWFYWVRGVEFESIKYQSKANYESEKNRAINQIMTKNQESPEAFFLNLDYLWE